jgi:hypothetical protein
METEAGRNFIRELKEFQMRPMEGLYLAFSGKTKSFVLCRDRPAFYQRLTEEDLILFLCIFRAHGGTGRTWSGLAKIMDL